MKYFLLSLCLVLAGCSKNSSQPQPSGPLKKDPGIDAAVYAFQSIDYVENSCVEKPAPADEVTELSDLMDAAINKIPDSDPDLRKALNDFHMRLLDLAIKHDEMAWRHDIDFKFEHDLYHGIRNELLETIKKKAAERNAVVELKPPDELEVAHPPDPKWKYHQYNDHGKDVTFYELRAKNAVVEEDIFRNADRLLKLELSITCKVKEVTLVKIGSKMQTDKVRLRFDSGPPVTEKWNANNSFIYTPHPEQLFARLSKAKTFSIELTPNHRNPQTVIFNLSNFKETIGEDWDCKR